MIFRNAVILAFCLFKMVAFSQKNALPLPSIHNDTVSQNVIKNGDTVVYLIVEHQPEFIGGYKALLKFIKDHLRFPSGNFGNIVGTVYVGFIVTKEGKVVDAKIKRGIHPAFNDEAIRVTNLTSGKWKAGTQKDKPVSVMFNMPVKFEME
jgi:TonB family protein